MTEQEAKALASSLADDADWSVADVAPWPYGAAGEWAVWIAHKQSPRFIYVHPACFSGEQRNHDYRVQPRPGERLKPLTDA